jgi:hypothetical protein
MSNTSTYTVIYLDGNGIKREVYVAAPTTVKATLQAREVLPDSCEIVRVYLDS